MAYVTPAPPILRVSFVAVPFRRPFSVRDPHEPGRAATPLELFFDLIFVVAIASNVVQLHHGITEVTSTRCSGTRSRGSRSGGPG